MCTQNVHKDWACEFSENRAFVTDVSHCDSLKRCENGVMQIGQKVRVKAPNLARDWNIPRGTEGTVECAYRVLRNTAVERLDVRFSPYLVVWGAPADAFELIARG